MLSFRGACSSLFSVLIVFTALPFAGCSDDTTTPMPSGPTDTEVLTPNAPPLPGQTECKVVMSTNIAQGPAMHVATCTPVKYETNPPSGGDHWGQWVAFKKYTQVVPREMYVHDLEHGAVVLAYRCDGECPEVVMALEKVFDDAKADPLCLTAGSTPKARLVLTPDPLLDTPIAAAAWGATYTATCIDTDSLAQFVAANYGKGTEVTCFNGQDLDVTGAPMCGGT
jgi:Protein of unknown function (DUF3105)